MQGKLDHTCKVTVNFIKHACYKLVYFSKGMHTCSTLQVFKYACVLFIIDGLGHATWSLMMPTLAMHTYRGLIQYNGFFVQLNFCSEQKYRFSSLARAHAPHLLHILIIRVENICSEP